MDLFPHRTDDKEIAILHEGDISEFEDDDEGTVLQQSVNQLQEADIPLVEVDRYPVHREIFPPPDTGSIDLNVRGNPVIEPTFPSSKININSVTVDDTEQSSHDIKRKTKLRWRVMDIEQFDTACNIVYCDPPTENLTPYQYFKEIITDRILENLVEQSNLYCTQITGSSLDTSLNEMEQFLGINILSGIVRVPSYRMYWAESTRFPPIADVMARNRFDKIRTYLHINDNTNMKQRDHPQYDKLFKVRPFLTALQENYNKVEPEEFNTVDEIMIPFKGRSSIKQFIPNKPHKWGIKVFARASVSGIIHDFEVYVGKGTVHEVSSLGISGDVVIRLIKGLPKDKNYKLFTDNWFISYSLVQSLKDIGILSVGTVRMNRVPDCNLAADKEMKNQGRGADYYRTETSSNIIALKWFDNKPVHLISSYKGKEPTDKVKRYSVAEKSHIQVNRPSIVKEYNSFMGGVDLNGMLVSLYRTNIGVRRFYLRIFYHLIDVTIVNCWLLYRRHLVQNNQKYFMKLLEFRSQIAHSLLMAEKTINKKRGRPSCDSLIGVPTQKRKTLTPSPTDDVRFDQIGHWPVSVENRQRCKLCIKVYSNVMCVKCKKVLCLKQNKNCFMDYHNKK